MQSQVYEKIRPLNLVHATRSGMGPRNIAETDRDVTQFFLALVDAWRDERGGTDRSFAKQVGIIASNVSQWRAGTYNVGGKTQRAVATALGLSHGQLLQLVDERVAGKHINLAPLLDRLERNSPPPVVSRGGQSLAVQRLRSELDRERAQNAKLQRDLDKAQEALGEALSENDDLRAKVAATEKQIEVIRTAFQHVEVAKSLGVAKTNTKG